MRSSGKVPEEAVVDEEAILSLLESSQTFLPLSQTSNHSPLLGVVSKMQADLSVNHLILNRLPGWKDLCRTAILNTQLELQWNGSDQSRLMLEYENKKTDINPVQKHLYKEG